MDTTSAPLADYFWIAGIDSLSYGDHVFGAPIPKATNGNGPPSPAVDATIEEGSESEAPDSPPSGTPRATARHSRNNSWNRLSKLSNDARNSIQTLDELETTRSNRSSITIKALNINGNGEITEGVNGNGNGNGGMADFEFDRALVKFANERENFLDDLSFSAGAPTHNRPPMTNPRAERLRVEDQENIAAPGKRSPLRSVGGSIRRRISFRDMNSAKRQPAPVQRNGELELYILQGWIRTFFDLWKFERRDEMPKSYGSCNWDTDFWNSFCTNLQKTEQLQFSHSTS
jgi:hypothetical protein